MAFSERKSLFRDSEINSEEDDVPAGRLKSWMNKKISIGLLTFVLSAVILIIALVAILDRVLSKEGDGTVLQVDSIKIMNHLKEFQAIAYTEGGSRSTSTGYGASATYIMSKLKATNLQVSQQYFTVPVFQEISSPLVNLIDSNGLPFIQFSLGNDFTGLPYGGNGTYDITAPVVDIPNFGCSSNNFGSATGKIVLIQSWGSCFPSIAAFNAQNAGAKAILFWNSIPENKLYWLLDTWGLNGTYWKQGNPLIQIPILSITATTYQIIKGNK
jgi:hypothetical protein